MQSCDAGSRNCVTIDLSLLIDKLCGPATSGHPTVMTPAKLVCTVAALLISGPAALGFDDARYQATDLDALIAERRPATGVVQDGQTFGLTAEQRSKVSHVRSFGPDVNENVYWLELSEIQIVRRPSGFFSRLFGSDSKH